MLARVHTRRSPAVASRSAPVRQAVSSRNAQPLSYRQLRSNSADSLTPKSLAGPKEFFSAKLHHFGTDGGQKLISLIRYHKTAKYLAVVAPISVVLAPSIVNVPLDLALNVLIPIHGYIGMKAIIEDYLSPYKGYRWAIIVLWVITAVMFLGFFKLNWYGQGLSMTIKSLWLPPVV